MTKMLIDIWMDGYDDPNRPAKELEDFIYDNLDSGGVSVTILDWEEIEKFIKFCRYEDLQVEENYFKVEEMATEIWEKLNKKEKE